jgi:hypothetical protein
MAFFNLKKLCKIYRITEILKVQFQPEKSLVFLSYQISDIYFYNAIYTRNEANTISEK